MTKEAYLVLLMFMGRVSTKYSVYLSSSVENFQDLLGYFFFKPRLYWSKRGYAKKSAQLSPLEAYAVANTSWHYVTYVRVII